MTEEIHSGKVAVPDFSLQQLINVAPRRPVEDLGELKRAGNDYLVEAIRLSEFLEEFHGDEQLIELSEGGYEAVVDAMARQGYPLRRSDYPTAGD